MDYSEEEIADAVRSERLICEKLLEIMDLQADIDGLMRDSHPTPFGSAKWKNARPEVLQRLVMMAAIQFVLFEPDGLVKGNDELRAAAEKLVNMTSSQLQWLREKYPKKQDSDLE